MQQVYRPQNKSAKKKRRGHKRWLVLVLIIAIAGVGGYLYQKQQKTVQQEQLAAALQPVRFEEVQKKGILKIYTGEEFKKLYNSFAYPNTELINEETPITGNVAADTRIRDLAEQRGYLLRSAPVMDTFQPAGNSYELQQRAVQPWLDMQAAAKKDNEILFLTAGYRSAEEQKVIFMERLASQRILIDRIPSGTYDAQLDKILASTAIPGYSRHHTGYTIDIGCENDPAVVFEASSCFKWLSSDNYKNAKQFGWIPSYPEGSGRQGPDPESWEYVWVGVDALSE